ncbi:hypothetical protein T552_03028 [Pneumocystis carinii B80]|uniref:Uncharacterized protein n=1 Tax=Pneumocystis carinii (strain B80) TaxID=1408658 RepID=A0A0W4ZCV4_PNEC8|nr:hypothetical protein T552_03028 [Pneumocystis carinii B80]KTW26135.1 hypothetical protein T552_03028 [Pneumocystis carinii B80]
MSEKKVLIDRFPGRTAQIEQLAVFLEEKKISQIPSLIIHGHRFTGKSSVLRGVLECFKADFVWIDCQDCFSQRILLERTIYELREIIGKNKEYELLRLEDFGGFTVSIQNLFLKTKWKSNVIMVFDHVEQLHQFKVTIPTIVLLRLAELSFVPYLTTVLITTSLDTLSWGSYHVPTIYFPPYSKSEFIEIMSLHKDSIVLLSNTLNFGNEITSADGINLWQKFCRIIWDTFGSVIEGDFDLFFSISKKLWPIFIEPIKEGKATNKDIIKLYKFSQQAAELSSSKAILEELSKLTYHKGFIHDFESQSVTDLSWASKYLIIASYLASYNPPKYDFALFSRFKDHTKKRKRIKKPTSTMISQRLIGPKSFVLERMLTIFLAIQSNEDILTFDIYTQIENLATLKMIIRTSLTSDKLDSASRWKVNVSWNFVQKIAKSVGFELEDYLIE